MSRLNIKTTRSLSFFLVRRAKRARHKKTTRVTEGAKRESRHPRFSRLSRGFFARRLCACTFLPKFSPPSTRTFLIGKLSPFFFSLSLLISIFSRSSFRSLTRAKKLATHTKVAAATIHQLKLPALYCKRRLYCVVSSMQIFLTLFMSLFQFSTRSTFTISSKNGEKIPSGPCPVA